jgi:TonB family protein
MRPTFAASVLLSPLFLSAAAIAAPPVTNPATDNPVRQLSTGVKPARVLSATNITIPSAAIVPNNAEFVLHLNVTPDGKAEDVQVIRSASSDLDATVAAAVRQFRFRPATLDNQPVATDMTLDVFVQR